MVASPPKVQYFGLTIGTLKLLNNVHLYLDDLMLVADGEEELQ